MSEELEPLPDDVAALLTVERTPPPPPAAAKARVRDQLTAPPKPAAPLPIGKVLMALGAVTIAATYFVLRSPAEIAAPADAPITAPVEQQPPAPPSPPQRARAPIAAPLSDAPSFAHKDATLRSSHRRMVPPSMSETIASVAEPQRPKTLLAEERGLLDSARSALRHDDLIGARVALKKHEREYAGGQLEEEREALWVLVLEAEGDGVAAATKADQFSERWPNSMFSRSVKAAAARATMKQ
jgi:hypothetical protein